MKKALLLLSFMAFYLAGKSQVMSAKAQWVTIKSNNLHCWECKERLDKYLLIENNASFESGMLKWNFNLINGELKVFYLPDRVSIDDIRTAMNNAGFDADSTKAEPLAYKKLPPACKLNSEGGGPQKGKPCHLQPY